MHKFAVGQIVKLAQNVSPPVDAMSYVIIRLVSGDDSAPQYRIKSAAESVARIVRESELTLARSAAHGQPDPLSEVLPILAVPSNSRVIKRPAAIKKPGAWPGFQTH